MDDVLRTAKSCRHYSMCKIDYLGGGVCPSGLERFYVSYYPVGRMDLYAALAEGRIPITKQCVQIADSCDLCGKCDYQCYFITELRPTRVMEALKRHVEEFLARGGEPEAAPVDPLLGEIQAIVGEPWATNDPAIRLTYSHDPCPVAAPRMPAYVVLPRTRDEISALVRLLRGRGVRWVARGNGSSVMGLVFTDGAVIDLGRMQDLAFDEKNWVVRVGPGISAFELQREAVLRGYRVNVAEPAALVCSNVVGTGIFSTFMPSYGTAASNFTDAQFVAADGTQFSLSDPSAPNLFAFRATDVSSPGICTEVSVKLHPMTDDEEGLLVPFTGLRDALDFVRDCAVRRIGLALGVLGGEYVSAFLAPTKRLAEEAKETLTGKLGIEYLALVVGDRYARRSVREMGVACLDQRTFRALALGLPSLRSAAWTNLLTELSAEEPFSYLKADGFAELAEAALAPSPAQLVRDVDPELRPFFEEVYTRPEMTDLVWLNMFRILSARMGRQGHFLIFILYLPLESALIEHLSQQFRRIATSHGLRNDLGFVTPLDGGKRAILEYDYFFDQTDPDAIARVQQAGMEAASLVEDVSARLGTVRWIRHVVNQGVCRMENLLYACANEPSS